MLELAGNDSNQRCVIVSVQYKKNNVNTLINPYPHKKVSDMLGGHALTELRLIILF